MNNRYLIEIITEDLPISDLNENIDIIQKHLKFNIDKNKIKFFISFITYKRFIFLFISNLNIENYLKLLIENIFFSLKFTINMRWENNFKTFIRPIISYLFLFNDVLVDHNLFEIKSSKKTIIFKKNKKKIINVDSSNYFKILDKYKINYNHNFRYEFFLKKINIYLNVIKANIIIDDNILNKLSNSFEILGLKFIKINLNKFKLNNKILSNILLNNYYIPVIKSGKLIGFLLVTDGIYNKCIVKNYKRSVLLKIIYFKKIYFKDFKLINFKKIKNTILNDNFDTLYLKMKRLYLISKYFFQFLNFNLFKIRKMIILVNSEFLTKFIYEYNNLNGLLFVSNNKYSFLKNFLYDYNNNYFGKKSNLNESFLLFFSENLDDIINLFILNKFPKGKKDPFNVKKKINSILLVIIKNKIFVNFKNILLKIKNTFFLTTIFDVNKFLSIIIDKMKSYFNYKYIHFVKNKNDLYKLHLYSESINNFFMYCFKNNLFFLLKRINNIVNKNKCSVFTKINKNIFQNIYEKILFLKFIKIIKINNILKKKNNFFSIIKNFLTIENDLNNFFSNTFILDKNFDIANNRLKLLKTIKYFINKNINFDIENMK